MAKGRACDGWIAVYFGIMYVPDRAGVMILSEAILFPHVLLPLYIFEPRYRRLLEDALDGERMFCVAMKKPHAKRESPLAVAGLGMVRASVRSKDGSSHLVLQGLARVRLGPASKYKPYRVHKIEVLESRPHKTESLLGLRSRILDLVELRLRHTPSVPMTSLMQKIGSLDGSNNVPDAADCLRALREIPDMSHFADVVAVSLLGDMMDRQIILHCIDLEARLNQLEHLIIQDLIRIRDDEPGNNSLKG
jgi:ATP-dependent Lon protease